MPCNDGVGGVNGIGLDGSAGRRAGGCLAGEIIGPHGQLVQVGPILGIGVAINGGCPVGVMTHEISVISRPPRRSEKLRRSPKDFVRHRAIAISSRADTGRIGRESYVGIQLHPAPGADSRVQACGGKSGVIGLEQSGSDGHDGAKIR